MTPGIPSADFTRIRYAQCWEDADILVEGLNVQPGDHCISIASAGDNTLALLTADPASVTAVDMSASQLACLHLRIAAYRCLSHAELLQLIGSRPCTDRTALYDACRDPLPEAVRSYWDTRRDDLQAGLGALGKFENYFKLFRSRILPLIHSRRRIDDLLSPKSADATAAYYDREWDTFRWRLLFRIFFSRFVMGRLGRDPSFFQYVEGSVSDRILGRTRHALRNLTPAENPYLHWILTGTHRDALPLALRPENFETIRSRLDRIHMVHGPVQAALDRPFDRANLSDLFEYLSPEDTHSLLQQATDSLRPGGRLLYWNMLAPRASDDRIPKLHRRPELEQSLLSRDKAWFYSKVIVEEKGSEEN